MGESGSRHKSEVKLGRVYPHLQLITKPGKRRKLFQPRWGTADSENKFGAF